MEDFSIPLKHLNFKADPNVESNPSFGDVYQYSDLCCLQFVSWCQEIPWKLLDKLIADVYMYNDLCNLGFVR